MDSSVSEDYTGLIDYSGYPVATYFGEAVPGSNTSDQVWRIRLISNNSSSGVVTVLWADGNNNFDNIWDNRKLYVYS